MAEKKDIQLLPVYLVNGEDHLKRDVTVNRLKARLEKLGDLSFNSDRFDGASADGEAIAAACETMPFASEKRLVVVNDADKLSKASQKVLVEYVKAPCESTVLLLVSDKLAKNTALYKAVAAVGKQSVIDCTPPQKRDLPNQVRAMAPSHGITIAPKAAALLVELVGEDTVHLDEELKKLALSCGGKDAISEADVRALVARVNEAKPWQFVDAFSARNVKECMRILAIMPSASPHALLRQCVSRIRELICAKSMSGSANPQRALAEELGMQDWRVKNHMSWARGFSDAELRDALRTSLDCERKMKGGSDPEAAFLDWVLLVAAR